jgi:Na+/melibiose symporter-like transporter
MALGIIWFPIAILVGVLFVVATVLFARNLARHRVPATSPEERAEMASLPMTALQKRAWVGLLVGLGMVAGIVVTITRVGLVAYFEDDDLRTVVLLFMLGALLSYLYVLVPTAMKGAAEGGLDERDKRILAAAPHIQAAAGLITFVAWSVFLTETYRGEGIPTGFMSLFIAYMLAHSVGILFGYWFARDHGEG